LPIANPFQSNNKQQNKQPILIIHHSSRFQSFLFNLVLFSLEVAALTLEIDIFKTWHVSRCPGAPLCSLSGENDGETHGV